MIADTITPNDRRLLADAEGIDPVQYTDWLERPEIQRVLEVRQMLAESRERDQAFDDVRFAIDTLKSTIAANKDLSDPRRCAETRRAATTIIQIAAAILNGTPSRHVGPPTPRPPRLPRPRQERAGSNGQHHQHEGVGQTPPADLRAAHRPDTDASPEARDARPAMGSEEEATAVVSTSPEDPFVPPMTRHAAHPRRSAAGLASAAGRPATVRTAGIFAGPAP